MKHLLMLAGALFALVASTLPGYTMSVDPADVSLCGDVNPDVTDNVLDNNGCFVFGDVGFNLNQDFNVGANILTLIDADESVGEGDTGLSLTGDTKTGTWSIDNYDPLKDYFLVFKDGTNALPGSQIGYLLDGATGTYESPFYNDLLGMDQKDISFWALFEVTGDDIIRTPRENPPPAVPLPAGILLMGTGIAAFGALYRQRRREQV